MGVERVVRFPGPVPAWAAVLGALRAAGHAPVVRMIDGLPAFPDEEPPPDCRELRVGLPGGMVTLRRGDEAMTAVVWGTADPALAAAQTACAEACEQAGGGG